jgi:hypothetical protein
MHTVSLWRINQGGIEITEIDGEKFKRGPET